jgi:hypothetical protein
MAAAPAHPAKRTAKRPPNYGVLYCVLILVTVASLGGCIGRPSLWTFLTFVVSLFVLVPALVDPEGLSERLGRALGRFHPPKR